MRTTLELTTRPPFDFAGTAYSHGWVVLAPNDWDEQRQVLRRVERLGTGKVVSLRVRGPGNARTAGIAVEVESPKRLAKKETEEIARKVGHMFRLDEDLSRFYRECRRRGGHWNRVTKGLGRLLRSPSVFEDVVKTIATTNVQWGGTKKMIAGLTAAYGEPMPGDGLRRAFPTPEAIASAKPKGFAASVRMGYRAPYVHALARQVASGALDLESLHDPERPTSELKKRLLSIKGIGNYAAATLLMLLGRYDDLPVDTVCRDFVTKKYFGGKPPADAEIQRVYEDWGHWKYLAYWFDVWAGRNEPL